jgi:hypothetical protein
MCCAGCRLQKHRKTLDYPFIVTSIYYGTKMNRLSAQDSRTTREAKKNRLFLATHESVAAQIMYKDVEKWVRQSIDEYKEPESFGFESTCRRLSQIT